MTALEAIRDRPDSTEAYRTLGDRALTVVGDRDPFVPVEDARRFEPDASCSPPAAISQASSDPRSSASCSRSAGAMDVERDEVVRRLGEEGFVVLDVRSEGEYRARRPCRATRAPVASPGRSTSTCRCCSR